MSVPRHTAYNLAGSLTPILVSLITVPIYLNRIGLDRYGVLAICWLVLGYFSFFDFGVGRAAAQRIASLVDDKPDERSRIFWVALQVSAILSIVAMIIFAPLSALLLGSIHATTPELRTEVHASIPLLICCVPFGVLSSLLGGALTGRREFLKMNLFNSFGTTLTAVLPLAAAVLVSPALPTLIAGALLGRLISALLMLNACRIAVPIGMPQRAHRGDVRALLSFGAWITVSNVIGPILVFWDRFLIGALIGAAAVAIYVIPFNLAWQTIVVPNALTGALYPRLAAAPVEERRRLVSTALKVMSVVMLPAMLFAELAAGPFLHLWIGPSRGALATPIACILFFGIWSNSVAVVPAAHLEAQARPDVLAKLHVSQVVPYATALFIALKLLGTEGAALVWALRCFSDPLVLFWVTRDRLPFTFPIEAGLLAAAIVVNLVFPLSSVWHWVLLLGLFAAGSALVLLRNRDVVAAEWKKFAAAFPARGLLRASD